MASTVNVLKSALKRFVGGEPEKKRKKKPVSSPKPKPKPKPVQKSKPKPQPKPRKAKVTVKPKPKQFKKKSAKPKKKAVLKQLIVPPETLSKQQALKLLKRKDALEFITSVAGKEGIDIYKFLVQQPGEIDEFTLADSVKLQINFARSLLYKLYEHKLVSFSRERDKKKGWFIYSWQSHPVKLKQILVQNKQNEIQKLEKQITAGEAEFVCSGCGKTFDYATSMETMFFCSVCGGKLDAVNSFEMQSKIKNQIETIKKEKEELEKI